MEDEEEEKKKMKRGGDFPANKPVWSHTCLFFLLLTTFDPGNGGLGKGGSGRSPRQKRHFHYSAYLKQ